MCLLTVKFALSSSIIWYLKKWKPLQNRHTSLSSQPVSNNENVCAVADIVPDPLIASF